MHHKMSKFLLDDDDNTDAKAIAIPWDFSKNRWANDEICL